MDKFEKTIRLALKEDISTGDITTNVFVPSKYRFRGIITAKEKGVLCGIDIAKKAFQIMDSKAKFKVYAKDGVSIKKGQKLMQVEGSRKILTAERTALNFLQRLSGIATFTSKFAKELKKGKTYIYDTRKTTPGLRIFEKYAVKCGGGKNHRMGLYDAFLIKDNHIAALGANPYSALEKKIDLIRKKYKNYKIEIEAKTINQVEKFILLNVDIIMLDNMTFAQMKKAIKIIRRKKKGKIPEVEISGNVNLSTLRKLSALSPERISAGSLTHSAPSLDISFNITHYKEI
ncbi:MAG: carboxylating nicotinate-nucleotide diphosphorylase [Elusimicrobiota bacterium]|nr:carboxylating nicotinate-nucleotide diphosphorylase [Elusimicrobiota bacterium]